MRYTWLSGSRIKLRQSGTGMLWYQSEMLDAGIPNAGGIGLDADAQLW
jgi:hypothetical protein